MHNKRQKRLESHRKIRMKIMGTPHRPRLSVFRSARHIYAQLVDDQAHKVLVSVSDVKTKQGKKSGRSLEVGKQIAKEALTKKIGSVVFDRGGYRFHGRVKAVADGARQAGLKF